MSVVKKKYLCRVVLFLSLCMVFPYVLKAEENKRVREIGFTFSNLRFSDLKLSFRIGDELSLWRFNYIFMKGNNRTESTGITKYSDAYDSSHKNNFFEVRVGKEYRKKLGQHIELRYGLDFRFHVSSDNVYFSDDGALSYNLIFQQTTKFDRSKAIQYISGINFVFGFNYIIQKNVLLGIELLPGFYYSTSNYKYYLKKELVRTYKIKTLSYNIRGAMVFSLMC